MKEHGMGDITISRNTLRSKIQDNVQNVQFTRACDRSKPSLIHSNVAHDTAVCDAAKKSDKEEIDIIFQCAKITRQAIERTDQWTFEGSLKDPHNSVPNKLMLLLKEIVQGHNVVQIEARVENIRHTCTNLSQQIIQAHKSTRQILYKPTSVSSTFRSSTETPLTLGLALHIYHMTRSKNIIDILSHTGASVSYQHTLKRVDQIAKSVQTRMQERCGVYIPPGLLHGRFLRAAIDNIDAKVDTPDGKMSFHALAGSVFQKKSLPGEDAYIVGEPLKLDTNSLRKLDNVPPKGVDLVPCTISGTPKPQTSPQYPDFKAFQHKRTLEESERSDLVWLLARYYNCRISVDQPVGSNSVSLDGVAVTEEPTELEQKNQQIPVWAGYNSLVASAHINPQALDNVHALPLINAPPQEWQTLVTSLTNLHNLNLITVGPDASVPLCVWLDMDLYKRVLKLAYLQPDLYMNKWIESPGQFHIVLCALRCLGKTVEGSGLDDVWVDADIYSSVVVSQIINGNHYNRAIECHQVTLQALADMWFDAFFEKHQDIYDNLTDIMEKFSEACKTQTNFQATQEELLEKLSALDLKEKLDESDANNQKYPRYKWTRMYMRQVETLLQFLRSTRQRDWDLHLAALEEMCIWFFAYNTLDYAMHIPEYIARIYQLQYTHPVIWEQFKSGEFAISTNSINFTAIGVDQAQEHLNKIHKGDGGVSGITSNPHTLLRYCLSTPELSRLSQETEQMLGMQDSVSHQHHDLSGGKLKRQEKYIHQLKEALSRSNPFKMATAKDGTEMMLVHFTRKSIIPADVQENILGIETQGQASYTDFVEQRISGNQNLWGKMTKVKVLGWNAGCKTSKTKIGAEEVVLKASSSLMARLLVITRSSRDIDLKDVIGKYELSLINHMLMTVDGVLHPCNDKAQLIHQLEALVETEAVNSGDSNNALPLSQPEYVIPDHTCILFDGMAVVHEMIVFKDAIKTCQDLADHFVHAIDSKSASYDKAFVIFDNYSIESLKEITRDRHSKGTSAYMPEYKVEDNTRIRDFNRFLNSTKTKDMLTGYLAQKMIDHCEISVTTVTRMGLLSNHRE